MAERKVLSLIPRLRDDSPAADATGSTSSSSISSPPDSDPEPDPFGPRCWRRSLVPLAGKNRALNEVFVHRVGDPHPPETLVMIHGYGAGLGFFYKNLEPVSRIPGLRLYALDMLGMGNSSRPPFKMRARSRLEQAVEAENWFVDALEEWRVARGIDRFTLLGHSLGGYLAVSYALKYPGHLKKLILASPVGIPEDPYADADAAHPRPQESTLENEFTQDQRTVTENGSAPSSPTTAPSPPPDGAPKRPLPGWLVWLWDANVSPFSIVRLAGPIGPRLVSGWSSRRFNHLPDHEARALHDYSFSIFKQRGSGEYALGYLLAPGAYARRPIINRIQDVGRQPLPSGHPAKESGYPVVFMYGENDWMDVKGGIAAKEKLDQVKARLLLDASDEEKRTERGDAKVVIIPRAGHHLYLDNPDGFNDVLKDEMEDTMRADNPSASKPSKSP